MDPPAGLDPYIARQHLLHHTYSPLISIQSTHNVDVFFQSLINDTKQSLTTLQIFKPFGDNAKYTIPNQQFRITNSQLITKNYASFPIRFEPSIVETIQLSNVQVKESIKQLFSITSLNHYLKLQQGSDVDLYLLFFDKLITSNQILAFDTFNHPISQIFIMKYKQDTIEELRKLIVEFRNFNKFPKYFQLDDLLIHVFIICEKEDDEVDQFQNELRAILNVSSTTIPIHNDDDEVVEISLIENCTLEEDLQRISMNDSIKSFNIAKQVDLTMRLKVNEYLNKWLIPHMESKIRVWDDQVLQPKKSITQKFFQFKKLFNNNDSIMDNNQNDFNQAENCYYKSSSQQILRKLGDWSLILKDFKYSYSIYDMIRKDYTNEKAWIYASASQEMCIVSLLLAQTQQVQQMQYPDKNTLRKIRHDIIEPFMDNLSYTFKSRFTLKTFNIKSMAVVVELLLCMSQMYQISYWWNDLIEKYLISLNHEFQTHLGDSIIKAILLERLGYNTGHFMLISSPVKVGSKAKSEVEDGFYANDEKLEPTVKSVGLTRYRKSSLYYLLSILQWRNLKNENQIQNLKRNLIYDRTYLKENLLLNNLYTN